MIVKVLIRTAACSREYLDDSARRATIRFVKSRWNRDGGARGKKNESDLYFTVFAAMCMRTLKGCIPRLRLRRYLHSFGDGSDLDIIRLFSLVRLRSIYPMTKSKRDQLMVILSGKQADSATDIFFKVIMAECLEQDDRPEVRLAISGSETTSNIAAAAVVNLQPDGDAEALLLQRCCSTGGVCSTAAMLYPNLESTAKALFALRILGADLSSLRTPCLDFIESLRRDDGGYVGHGMDNMTDVENTFYALLGTGCLVAGELTEEE